MVIYALLCGRKSVLPLGEIFRIPKSVEVDGLEEDTEKNRLFSSYVLRTDFEELSGNPLSNTKRTLNRKRLINFAF